MKSRKKPNQFSNTEAAGNNSHADKTPRFDKSRQLKREKNQKDKGKKNKTKKNKGGEKRRRKTKKRNKTKADLFSRTHPNKKGTQC